MLNKVLLNGRLVKDPERVGNNTNHTVVTFSVACQRDIADKDGNYSTDYFNCVAFGNTANYISSYIRKGNLVTVSGRLTVDTFTNKQGQKQQAYKISAEQVYLLEKPNTKVKQENNNAKQTSIDDFVDYNEPVDEDDLPF